MGLFDRGIGGFFSSILGGENKGNRDPNAMKAPELNRNDYHYGGEPGGADAAANRYQGIANMAQDRGGVGTNYMESNWDRMQAGQARTGLNNMADAMGRRALGQVPSIAQMQADRQMGQAQAAQMSAAAGARGPAALALAQQNAANNISQAQADISGQAQINAANERMQAEGAAANAYGNLRAGDQASENLSGNRAQFVSEMEDRARSRNDAMTMGMTANEIAVRNSELAAGQNFGAQGSANAIGAGGINAGIGGQNAGMNNTNGWGVIGLGRDVAGAAGFGGGPKGKAMGGPVGGQQPYLVGERGPELIVPAQNGTVIPAGQTRSIIQRLFGGQVEGVGAGIDMGSNTGMSADMVRAASTGLAGNPGGIAGMVGGGGITGGGGVPGGYEMRAMGGPVKGYCARAEGGSVYAPSTWGGGPDVAAQQAAMQPQADLSASIRSTLAEPPIVERGRDGFFLAGRPNKFANESPWERDAREVRALRSANPDLVDDADYERERRARGVLGMARQETEKTKAGEKKAPKDESPAKERPKAFGTIDAMIKAPVAEYRPMGTGYVPPQLLATPIRRASGGPVDAGVMPMWEAPGQELHQTDDGHAFLAMAPSREMPLAGGGLAAMSSASPVVARVPVSKAAANAPKKEMSEEELRRAADALEEQMRGEWDARMIRGPAIARMR